MLVAKDKAALGEIALFRDLTSEQLARLSELLHYRTFPRGTYIFREDQQAEVVYFIQSGTIKIHKEQRSGDDVKDVILNIVGAGDVLGDMSVVDGLGRSANAVTLDKSTLFWMNCDDFQQCLRTMPNLSYNLVRVFSSRLRLASTRIQMLSTQDVSGRVAHQLLYFASVYGDLVQDPSPQGGIRIPIRLTQNDLAQLVGATRVRVNQALGAYKELNYITVDGNCHITVHNSKALAKRYGAEPLVQPGATTGWP
jgi:CRP/FNR family cyclic AMP-dependent transcriptional regulator